MKILTQIWRLVRLAIVAFLAQLIASGVNPNHLTKQALISAGVAAAEALYRQFVPAGKTNGLLGNLVAAYQLVKNAGITANEATSAAASLAAPPRPVAVVRNQAGNLVPAPPGDTGPTPAPAPGNDPQA